MSDKYVIYYLQKSRDKSFRQKWCQQAVLKCHGGDRSKQSNCFFLRVKMVKPMVSYIHYIYNYIYIYIYGYYMVNDGSYI